MKKFDFEIQSAQTRYEFEITRRDSIRSSIAIPIAALSFAAFGFGTVVRSLIFSTGSNAQAYLSFMALVLTISSLFFLLSAISVFRRMDYADMGPWPEALDVHTQYEAIYEELVQAGFVHNSAKQAANNAAWGYAKTSFKDAADWQEVRNAQNLHSQQDMLSYFLWGVGCLLSALALGGIVQLLEAVETIS